MRPTQDKVRNAVFSSLYDAVEGAKVLDLFCGTGAYGLEALSRGASSAVFVDINTALVQKNAEMADRGTCRIIKAKAEAVLERLDKGFDLIFIDPPYGNADSEMLIKKIYDNEILANEGILIYEESVRTEFFYPKETFEIINEKKYGDTKIYYLSVK